jgi:hypothetical protein
MKRFLTLIACMAAALILGIGCDPKKPKQKGPEWVLKGSGAFDSDEGKVFYGVGAASGIQNRALLRATADNRARAEMAKIFETYVAVLFKYYMASTTVGDMSATSEERHLGPAIRSFSMTTLRYATIVDHWMDPNDGTLFALCKLDLAAVKGTLDDLEELDSKFRDYVRSNAEKIHQELEKIIK